MSLAKKDQVERAQEELSVLDGVIDYADRMIYEEGKRQEYGPLRRHAYGKTVVIETERQGVLTFRLSSTPVVYPKAASGYATPHSPVGRLCSFLRPGDEDESPRWGEYRVREIRLFDRFDGAQFEPNVRNFLRMTVEAEAEKGKVSDLRAFLAGAPASGVTTPPKSARSPVEEAPAPAEEAPAAVPAPPPAPAVVAVDAIEVIDDDDDRDGAPIDLDEDEADTAVVARTTEDYFGLSETFYVNRTREQDEVMSRSPIGPMFVEGVAGSGKTSAALGRTKMLCDFNANSVYEEAEFREVAGHSIAYWSGKFAGQFSQEGSVGFVRTGELIQYLKETCRRLDLPNLPVQEYPELRSRLRQHRRVERNKPGTARWAGMPEPRRTHADTTMAWLKGADRAMALVWAQALVDALPTPEKVAASFASDHLQRARRVAAVAVDRLRVEVEQLGRELSSPGPGAGFVLDRLATRAQACIQQARKLVLGKDVLWVTIGERTWIAQNEQEMASQLVAAKAVLFLRSTARLVFIGDAGPVDGSLALLSTTGQSLQWSEETRTLMDQGQVLVRDAGGKTVPAKASDVSDLYFRLMPEATEKLYVLRDGALRPLNLQRGLGKERLNLSPTAAGGADDEADADEQESTQDAADGPVKRRSVDAAFNSAARRALLLPLTFLADAYAEALAAHAACFPNAKATAHIARQLAGRKLADEDVDLLLCLAHIVGRGFTGAPATLAEPDFYQAVFVDEVQDFTEQQVYLMVEQARPEYRAVTVVGDVAQKLHNGSDIDIPACFPGESVPRVQLTENLRQLEAPGLAWFSACFRAELQDGLTGTTPSATLAERMREHADRLRGPELLQVDDEAELVEQVVEALSAVGARQTAAVILPNEKIAAAFHARCKAELSARMVDAELSEKIDLARRHVRHFTSVTNAKGLEFDVAIVPYLEHYDLGNSADVNRLYVALTRPRRKLVLVSRADRPESAFDAVWARYEDTVAVV
jgi:hypothetical protein